MGCVIAQIASMTTAGSKYASTSKAANAHLAVTVDIVTLLTATRGADSSMLLFLLPISVSPSPPVRLLGSVQSVGPQMPHVDSCILITRRIPSDSYIGLLAKGVLEISTLTPVNVPLATNSTIYSALSSTIAGSKTPVLKLDHQQRFSACC